MSSPVPGVASKLASAYKYSLTAYLFGSVGEFYRGTMDNKKESTPKGTKILYMSGAARAPIPLQENLEKMVIGQSNALSLIVPFIQTYNAGLNPANRPVANILLSGNTGLGKTSTVEALATLLHGNPKSLIRVDCGEFQADHEVAKLIGAPPGYLGHRETQPLFTQQRLSSIQSDGCKMSLILFDEIEKAGRGLMQILLGVMDKATLRLGDSSTVDFSNTLIFLSSNLGAKKINDALREKIGFNSGEQVHLSNKQIKEIIERDVKKHFSSEFYNRLDEIAYYYPLSETDLRKIVSRELELLQQHYNSRLGTRTFMLGVGQAMFDHILITGTSPEFGARELKRKISKYITQDIVALLNDSAIPAGSVVLLDREGEQTTIRILIDYNELPENYWFFDRLLSSSLVMEDDSPDDEAPKRRKSKK